MPALTAARRGFWHLARPQAVRELERRIAELSPKGPKSWYYHLDFGYGVEVRPELRRDPHAGEANWRWLEAHLPELSGKRILDVGCNAGLYDLRMCEAGAAEVVGIERDTRQAEFVRSWFQARRGADYSAARYVAGDARTLDFSQLGRFDMACLFCVLYHLGEAAERVIASLANVAGVVALQGNLPRTFGDKYRGRPYQDLAGVPGMVDILERHGFEQLEVVAPPGHPKPLVVGHSPR
jgi:SAM-dependent methyltransferase